MADINESGISGGRLPTVKTAQIVISKISPTYLPTLADFEHIERRSLVPAAVTIPVFDTTNKRSQINHYLIIGYHTIKFGLYT